MQGPTKIIITDDKKGYRKLFRDHLKSFNIETMASAENGLELLAILANITPDVVLLDVEMPVLDGVSTMKRLQMEYPAIKILVLSQHNDNALITEFEKLGARGYISKDEAMVDFEQLANIIEKIKRGKKHIMKNHDQPLIKLTEVQKEIIHYHGKFMGKKEISEALGITVDGVAKQEKKITAKFGLSNVKALTAHIIKSGLVFLRGRQNF